MTSVAKDVAALALIVLTAVALSCARAAAWPRVAMASAISDPTAAIMADLTSTQAQTRSLAARRLAELGESANLATPQLLEMLTDETPVVLEGVVENEIQVGAGSVTDVVNVRLETSPGAEAARALIAIGESTTVMLIERLPDLPARVRRSAGCNLAVTAEVSMQALFHDLIDDEVPELRACAAFALGKIADPASSGVLIGRLADPTPAVRREAATALGLMPSTDHIAVLARCLQDDAVEVRIAAAGSLGRIGPLATPVLIENLADVQSAAPRALVQIGRSALPALLEHVRDEEPQVRSNALWALGQIGDARAVDVAIDALADSAPSVRVSAVETLGMLGDRRAVLPLIRSLLDESANVRASAAAVLGEMGDSRAIEPLMARLDDKAEDVREEVMAALEMLQSTNR